jgi:hypothetical protein
MPLTFRLKRSSTPGAIPAAGSLSAGELAVNTADGRAYIKNDANAVVNLPVASISGQAITPSDVGLTTAGTAALPALSFTGDPNTGIYNPSADTLSVATGGVQRLAVGSTGVLDLLAGQIKFPADVNLSTNANTLDDYEEGTWTPTWRGSTTNPTVTYTVRVGVYVKIGQLVYVSGRLITATLTSAGEGTLGISGLPFTVENANGAYGSLAIGFRSGWTTNLPTFGYAEVNQTYILLGHTTAAAVAFTPVGNLTATTGIVFNCWYKTSA